MKILGYEYELVKDGVADDIGAFGRCHTRRRRLQVACDLAPDSEVSTVLHEIIEALKFHLGISLDHDNLMALEAGLYQALTENGVDLSPLAEELRCAS